LTAALSSEGGRTTLFACGVSRWRGGDSVRDGGDGAAGGDADGAAADVSAASTLSDGEGSSLLPEVMMRKPEPKATTAANPMSKGSLDERLSLTLSLSSSKPIEAARSGAASGAAIGARDIGAVTASCAAAGGAATSSGATGASAAGAASAGAGAMTTEPVVDSAGGAGGDVLGAGGDVLGAAGGMGGDVLGAPGGSDVLGAGGGASDVLGADGGAGAEWRVPHAPAGTIEGDGARAGAVTGATAVRSGSGPDAGGACTGAAATAAGGEAGAAGAVTAAFPSSITSTMRDGTTTSGPDGNGSAGMRGADASLAAGTFEAVAEVDAA
jgi:hypothetical protein